MRFVSVFVITNGMKLKIVSSSDQGDVSSRIISKIMNFPVDWLAQIVKSIHIVVL